MLGFSYGKRFGKCWGFHTGNGLGNVGVFIRETVWEMLGFSNGKRFGSKIFYFSKRLIVSSYCPNTRVAETHPSFPINLKPFDELQLASLTARIKQKFARNSTIQYSTVQYSTVQYSTVLYCTVLYCTIQCLPDHLPVQTSSTFVKLKILLI